MKKAVFFIFFIIFLNFFIFSNEPLKGREPLDDVGFAWRPAQIEEVVKLSKRYESFIYDGMKAERVVGAISPHDDYLYAGRVYIHALPYFKEAKIVVIVGVTHSRARKVINDRKGFIIFDNFKEWKAPYGNVKVSEMRNYIINYFNKAKKKDFFEVNSIAHEKEHSIEAMIPWLQYYNRKIEIVPIMITEMSAEKMDMISKLLSESIKEYAKEKNLSLGKDIKILISSDNTHYGKDFDYTPFGEDELAHMKATQVDKKLVKNYLSGDITFKKVKGFLNEVMGKRITWCGRFSVPFGVLLLKNLFSNIYGIPEKYGDSYSLGVLPIFRKGLGTTAPFSLKHWVGYWAVTYEVR